MYVHTYVRTYIHTHIYTYIIHIYIHTYIDKYVRRYVRTYIRVYTEFPRPPYTKNSKMKPYRNGRNNWIGATRLQSLNSSFLTDGTGYTVR